MRFEPLSVRCPICLSGAGDRCFGRGRKRVNHIHNDRRQRARATLAALAFGGAT